MGCRRVRRTPAGLELPQRRVARAIWKRRVLEAPRVERVEAIGEYGITLKILGSVRATEQWAAGGEFRKRLLAAFEANGIEIPRPQRVVLTRDPAAASQWLQGSAVAGPTDEELAETDA